MRGLVVFEGPTDCIKLRVRSLKLGEEILLCVIASKAFSVKLHYGYSK